MSSSPAAGYSGTPLPHKLGIGPGRTLFLDRQPAALDLGDLPAAHVVRRLPRSVDVTLTWHTTLASLEKRLPTLFERTTTAGMVWVCWPKRTAPREVRIESDLDENVVRALGLGLGWVDVKVAAIDPTWSGLKFVRRRKDR